MKILENKTIEEAVKYFEVGRDQYSHTPDHLMSEVYSTALQWKFKKLDHKDWGKYPIRYVAIRLIKGEIRI